MTDPAPPEEHIDTPVEAAKKKRTRLQLAAFVGGIITAVLIALLVVTAVGGRFYLLSGPGRELVTSFVAGKKLGRYGRINVEGVSGDILDDFRIRRVTVTDADGVWLEASDVHVDWSYWPLLLRRFHATEISAARIRLIRRPLVEPSTEPPGAMPLDIDIDKLTAEVELLEGFSKEYGRWRLAGEADVPRRGSKSVSLSADSLNRPGDFLRVAATFGTALPDLRLNLRAEEARGGPLAGALGYSPDRPFFASALINGEVVDATVRTGDFTPLTVKGRFAETGSRLAGRIDFSGSDLLEPFVDRIGRTARFGFATVPDRNRKDFHGVAWRVVAENFTSRAQGMIRITDRSAPDGVRVEASTPSLSRLAGHPVAGAASYVGTFTGDADNWRLKGGVTLNGADLMSYRAARIAGPLDLRVARGRMDFDGDLRATGGSTAGVIGGLLGSAPRIEVTLTRMIDGALLLRRVEASGQALRIDGSGSRGLNGALNFRGRVEITDAGRLHKGARGAFGGPVTASAAGPAAPWRITFDGRGRNLATGWGELDRLLGPRPRLELAGLLNGGRVEVDRGVLTGAAANVSTKGLIEGDGEMKLALEWTAQGPFGVGPLAIDGAMTGNGALTGTFAQPRADLRAAFEKVAAGPLILTNADLILSFRRGVDESDGRVSMTAGSNYGPARAVGNFFLGGDRLRLTEVDLDAGGLDASGDITLSNNFPSSADLTFRARPGAFLKTGQADGRIRLTDGAGDESAILEVTGSNVRLTGSPYVIRTLQLNGRGTLARLPFDLTTDVGGPTPLHFEGSGIYARTEQAQTVTLTGEGRVREVAFSTRTPAVVAFAADGRVARLDMNVGGGILLGELRSDSEAALLRADLTSVDLKTLAPDLRGSVTGRIALRGRGSDLSGSANVTLNDVRSIDAPNGLAVDGTLNAVLVDNQLRIEADARSSGQVEAHANVTLPVVASAAPLMLAIERTRPMSGEVSAKGEIQPIWDLFFGGDRSLAGQVDAQATLGGSINAPRLNGRMNLTNGSFRHAASGLRLGDMILNARFDDEIAIVERFTATDGSGGAVSGDGRLGLRDGSASTFELAFQRFRIIDNDLAEARASGPVTVTRGATGDITLTGRLNIDEGRVEATVPGSNGIVRMDVVEINRPGGDPEEIVERRSGPHMKLDIQLRSIGGNVRVVGRGLNVQMSVDATVGGHISEPTLTGTASVVGGDYEFAGKRFVFEDGGTVSLSTDPRLIRLNLSATRDDPALTATIRVTGTAAKPEIVLTSTPALPADEVLSQVLFGRSASQLSPIEAAQLAAGVASLAGGGGFDVIGNLRQLAGLDRLSFGGEASSLTVAGGRYITDDVYLEIIGGGESGAAVNVEWQVRRNLTVSSRFGGQGEASLSIRWRRESRPPGSRTDRRPNR
ncbi:MAG: translocation/assembly module TamB domain-containing protein [Pseudomonadota bacterium]